MFDRPISVGAPCCSAVEKSRRWNNRQHAEMEGRYLEKVSLRRMVRPYDVAGMVAFLLSDAGSNILGQSLGVDGNVETLYFEA